MTELARKFGKRLRYLRRQKDLSQEQFAEMTGLSIDFVSNLERSVNTPSFDTLQKLADALDIHVFELFDFRGQ
jgi:transcriptional regulator with XRE-family HTH domain